MSRTPGITLAAGAVGVAATLLSISLATRFMMSVFPAAERRKDNPPWAALVSLTDPILRPVRQLLQQVRARLLRRRCCHAASTLYQAPSKCRPDPAA